MTDRDILEQIGALVAEERELRARRAAGAIEADAELARLRQLEEALDQCWDLLRRRNARREAGGDPDEARPASVSQVENYLQ
ncbi:MAG: DUF2630 family protein [Frankia sp.]|nr:DUF2630 family protein [Frankia sp.]